MADDKKHECQSLQLLAWEEDCPWQKQPLIPSELSAAVKDGVPQRALPSSPLVVIQANADKIRKCVLCKCAFTKAFQIPELWWADYSRRSNGYFGCDTTSGEKGNIATVNTWSRYLVKQLEGEPIAHTWYKVNVFVKWSAAPSQTIVLLFDAPPELRNTVPRPLLETVTKELLKDPFLIHLYFAEEVVSLQNVSVWSLRTYVRELEKERENPPPKKGRTEENPAPEEGRTEESPGLEKGLTEESPGLETGLTGENPAPEKGRTKENPAPNFPRLHDLARHAIHICETLDLGSMSMESIIAHHSAFMDEVPATGHSNKVTYRHVHQRLAFFKHMFESLRCRSISNKQRLDNEMQLAFHTVAQNDSRTSVEIARATQSDSAAMKTISFLTLAFLPATFISAVFSMSFFNIDDESGEWKVSDKFWLYWAFAVPVTLITTGLWYWWQRTLYYPLIGLSDEKLGAGAGERQRTG